MALQTKSPEEAAEEALIGAGYSEIEFTGRRRLWMPGRSEAWMVSATALHQDGKRYELELPVMLVFGGLSGLIAQMRKREID